MEGVYLAATIPLFFVAIGAELWVLRRNGIRGYRFEDSITNLSCGVGSVIADVAANAFVVSIYAAVFTRLRLFELPADSWLVWAAALVGVDLCYYAFHRASHRTNVLWAGHIAHHQGEEYNLSVALRQSWYVPFFAWAFYVPLLVVGIAPLVVVAMRTFNTLYQFWIHTEAVGRLGPLEKVLNTPSHHRVHHGINPEYIDKNYAGIFIVWDRLFGTFVAEDRQVVYGLVKPLGSWNPLWANVHRFWEIAGITRRTRRWRDKLRVWVAGPEWLPEDLGGVAVAPPVTRETRQKYAVRRGGRPLRIYVAASFVVVAISVTALLLGHARMTPAQLALLSSFIVGSLVAWAGLFEGRSWARWLDASRWAAGAGAVVALL